MALLKALLLDESAQALTEYSLVFGAIAFAAIVTFLAMGGRLKQILGLMQTHLNDVPTS